MRAPLSVRATVGFSAEGRAIEALLVESLSAKLRIAVVAGQHGDEPLARKAARDLGRLPPPPDVSLAIVANANPDAAARRTRLTAAGIDMNRDHLLHQAVETRSLHRFLRSWRPHLILDVHNYPARRGVLLEENLVRAAEVCLDRPTNPALRPMIEALPLRRILKRVNAALAPLEAHSERYLVPRGDGTLRTSTLSVADLRNGAALSLGCATLLIEGRSPLRQDGPGERRKLRQSLSATLSVLIQWAAEEAALLRLIEPLSLNNPIPIRCLWRSHSNPRQVLFRHLETGCRERIRHPSFDRRRITQYARLPEAYLIPRSAHPILSVLEAHGCCMFPGESHGFPGAVVAPVTRRHSALLGILLEPDSRYGLKLTFPEAVQVRRLERFEGPALGREMAAAI